MRPNFESLSGGELVTTFNEMAVEAASLEIQATPVKRFSTRVDALRRIEVLYKTLCEKKGEQYEAPPQVPVKEATEPKAKKKPKAKAKAKTKAPKATAAPKKDRLELSEICGVRAGSKHETILSFLEARMGKQVPEETIIKHVYGDPDIKTNRIKDLQRIMKTVKRYHLKREKDEKGNISYGLYTGASKSSDDN